jgi:hypothetical protein
MSELKIIRVFDQGKGSTMQKAYDVAKYQVKFQYSSLFIVEYEERNITDIVNLNCLKLIILNGCWKKMAASSTATHSNLKRISPLPVIGIIIILLSKLKEEATAKGICMFPNPDLVDVDPTFSQVILRISHVESMWLVVLFCF